MKIRLFQIIKTPFLLLNIFLLIIICFQHVWSCSAMPNLLCMFIGVVVTASILFLAWSIFYNMPDVYKHFKSGDLYEELFPGKVILMEDDMSHLVLYRPLFSKKHDADMWVRRYNVFHETVEDKGKKVCRFRRIM